MFSHAQSNETAGAGPVPKNATLVYVGTRSSSKGKGIYVYRLQPQGTEVFQNVTLVPLGLAAESPNPTFLKTDAKRRLMFAVNEVETFDGKPGGAVIAFSITAILPLLAVSLCILGSEGRNQQRGSAAEAEEDASEESMTEFTDCVISSAWEGRKCPTWRISLHAQV